MDTLISNYFDFSHGDGACARCGALQCSCLMLGDDMAEAGFLRSGPPTFAATGSRAAEVQRIDADLGGSRPARAGEHRRAGLSERRAARGAGAGGRADGGAGAGAGPHARSYSAASMRPEACSCLREALLVSEQMHYRQRSLASLSFDQTLGVAREAERICKQYLACRECGEGLTPTLCLNALRSASLCYKHLAAAAASASASADGSAAKMFRCRIGSFEAGALLDPATMAAILHGEVQRAAQVALDMACLLQAGSLDNGKVSAMDEATVQYHQNLVDNLSFDLDHILRQTAP